MSKTTANPGLKPPADLKTSLHSNHPDQVREDVKDALRWAMNAARAGNDYTTASEIAIKLISVC
jgi:hypothetical protein